MAITACSLLVAGCTLHVHLNGKYYCDGSKDERFRIGGTIPC
jgi:hypothetical protein